MSWAWVIGMVIGLAVSVISLFVGAWVHRQDHPVPVGLFGLAMCLLGVFIAVAIYLLA